MKKNHFFLFAGLTGLLLIACQMSPLEKSAKHYRNQRDHKSLAQVVEWLPKFSDSSYVRRLLGDPIDMGFDFRYLIDSTGPNGCVVGAVFHINEMGKIDQKWIDEICE